MKKVLINRCFGGFQLSKKAFDLFNERSETKADFNFQVAEYHRDDPILIDIVEELGVEAMDSCSKLVIAEVPDGYDYDVSDYDGIETLHLRIREGHLRKLIRAGNENDIVEYVMKAN